jgi:hypothetical protein
MMVAVGLVFLLEYLDDTIKNESDLQQYLGIPALGLIAKIRPEDVELRTKAEGSILGSEKNHVTVN